MRIINLLTENYKKLRCVRWSPGAHVNEIVGRNEAGKTSLIDSIWVALGGKRADCQEPIRKGAKSASVSLDLGDLRVRRTWTEQGSYLSLEDRNGNQMRSPQSLLDSLTSSIGMDPLAFSRMDAGDQARMLMDILRIDVSDLDDEQQRLNEERKEKSREAKRCRIAAEKIQASESTVEPIDITEVQRELEAAQSRVTELQLKLSRAVANQAMAQEIQRRDELIGEAEYLEYEVEQITKRLRSIADQRQSRLAEVGRLFSGLEIRDDGVYLDGLPLSQASTARRIRVGLDVAVAANPELRVILIRDGSLLDEQMMSEIQEFASNMDVQILIEKVGSELSGNYGVVIVDGEVSEKREPEGVMPMVGRHTWSDTVEEAKEVF